MGKLLRNIAFVFLALTSLASCVIKDDYVRIVNINRDYTAAFAVLNQGDASKGVSSSIDLFTVRDTNFVENAYYDKNETKLGSGLQSGVANWTNIYLAMRSSNRIWIIDRPSLAVKAMIAVPQPNDLLLNGKYLYVASNNGLVTRIDTTNNVSNQITVGPNPSSMVMANGYLYVANSDRDNVTGNYVNGRTVSKIRLSDFSLEKQIKVDNLPTRLVADGAGNVFVTCAGNDTLKFDEILKIDHQDSARHFVNANIMAARENKLFIGITNRERADSVYTTYMSINSLTGDTINSKLFYDRNIPLPTNPTSMTVSPHDGYFYITSDSVPKTDLTQHYGKVYQYRVDGKLLNRYTTGMNPVGVILLYEHKFYY